VAAINRAKAHSLAMLRPGWRPVVLCVLGLTCITVAAFLLHIVAGLVVAGLALLLLEWRLGDSEESAGRDSR
jgi:hypothetical protein